MCHFSVVSYQQKLITKNILCVYLKLNEISIISDITYGCNGNYNTIYFTAKPAHLNKQSHQIDKKHQVTHIEKQSLLLLKYVIEREEQTVETAFH